MRPNRPGEILRAFAFLGAAMTTPDSVLNKFWAAEASAVRPGP